MFFIWLSDITIGIQTVPYNECASLECAVIRPDWPSVLFNITYYQIICLEYFMSFILLPFYINTQSQLALRVWWSCVCHGFCQSRLLWLTVSVKKKLSCSNCKLNVRQTNVWRAFRMWHVRLYLKKGSHLHMLCPEEPNMRRKDNFLFCFLNRKYIF